MKVGVNLGIGVTFPKLATEGSLGFDLKANIPIPQSIFPGQSKVISTGLRTVLPQGLAMFIIPRSGTALRGLQVANAPGLIDTDYRGDIGIIAYNSSNDVIEIQPGQAIAQAVFIKLEFPEFYELPYVPETSTRQGGFGSTDEILKATVVMLGEEMLSIPTKIPKHTKASVDFTGLLPIVNIDPDGQYLFEEDVWYTGAKDILRVHPKDKVITSKAKIRKVTPFSYKTAEKVPKGAVLKVEVNVNLSTKTKKVYSVIAVFKKGTNDRHYWAGRKTGQDKLATGHVKVNTIAITDLGSGECLLDISEKPYKIWQEQ